MKNVFIQLSAWAGPPEVTTEPSEEYNPPGEVVLDVTRLPHLWTAQLQSKLNRYDKESAVKAGLKIILCRRHR